MSALILPMLLPLARFVNKSRQFTESNLHKIRILTYGFLLGSSASLPVLKALPSSTILLLNYIIFCFSVAFFLIFNAREVVENAPYALAGMFIFFIMGFVSCISLEGAVVYMPMWISIFLLCTTHIVPAIRRYIQEGNAIEESILDNWESNQAIMDLVSIQAMGTSHDSLHRTSDLFDFAHMEYLGRQQQISSSELPEIGSSIDLESSPHQHVQILSASQDAIVNRAMEEFWVIFNREWDGSLRECVSTPSSSSGGSAKTRVSDSTQSARSSLGPQKRKRDDEESPDENQDRTPRQPKGRTELHSGHHSNNKFACPFRKHNPQVYSIHDYRVCALTPWKTIARVKEHLYRCHKMPLYCKRCWTHFKTQEKLDLHLTVAAADICELKAGIAPEGITAEQERCLRSRKKSSPDQTDKGRWENMYKLLFPNEDIPLPYFEPPQDDISVSLESTELANYENYVRLELPRLVRVNMEQKVRRETQPLEEPLIKALVGVIQDCHDKVFKSYCESRGFGKHMSVLPSLENDGKQDLARCEQEISQASQLPGSVCESPLVYDAETTRTMIRTNELRNTLFECPDDLVSSAFGPVGDEQLYSCSCSGPCDLSCLSSQLQEGDSGVSVSTEKWGMDRSDIQWPDWEYFLAEKP